MGRERQERLDLETGWLQPMGNTLVFDAELHKEK